MPDRSPDDTATDLSASDEARAHGRYAEHMRRPLLALAHPAVVRAALWAVLSVRRARRQLRADGVGAHIAAPPVLPDGARRGVTLVLSRIRPTCLERSLVLQAWLAAHSVPSAIVVGVPVGPWPDDVPRPKGFSPGMLIAHAWLDVESTASLRTCFRELHRIPARNS